eukprot:TRINITY_DN63484_c0_g1_i1.p1 TRINITY_DN63484_c0_g1~~TRINITY_DN63484_c0_g1_i1.p1  ORF type:complete len:354 (+),score=71.43 TRINITY_DN63484_c0_g1_i1:104-1063(+)
MCEAFGPEDEVMTKTGKELFRELLRLYPVAEVEDYFANGIWKDDKMRLDVQLYAAHRSEAGANEPLPLEEVKLPADMPKEFNFNLNKPLLKVGVTLSAQAQPALQPQPIGNLTSTGELKEMAIFVAKHKLDPARAKNALTPLLAGRRKYVIQKFEPSAECTAVMDELEAFIKECEASKVWDTEPVADAQAQPEAKAKAPAVIAAGSLKLSTPLKGTPMIRPTLNGARPALAPRPVPAGQVGGPSPQLIRPGSLNVGGVKRPVAASPITLSDPSKRLAGAGGPNGNTPQVVRASPGGGNWPTGPQTIRGPSPAQKTNSWW